jgi:LPS export ABC transporter protein LptC
MGPKPLNADLSLRELQLQEESTGSDWWQLRADQAAVFDQEGRTALRNVTVIVHDRDRSWTVVGEEGDFFKASKDLEIRRNVVLTSEDGLRLETTVLRWQAGPRRMWTDAPVKIFRQGTVIDGTALDVRIADEATVVKGPVHATFNRAGR